MAGAALLAVYRSLWRATMPLVAWYVRRKDLRRLVPRAITLERFGYSKPPGECVQSVGKHWNMRKRHAGHRGDSFTLWIHGASVGECLSALPLVELALTNRLDQVSNSYTTGMRRKVRVVLSTTTTAARQLLSERLQSSDAAVCVLAPLDNLECVERFYDTWQPDAGLWVESELWPTLITEATRRGIRIGLVNGRLSPRSFRLWCLPGLHGLSQSVVGSFSLVLCQDEQNRKRYQRLGARNAQSAPNLKFASLRSINDEGEVLALQRAVGSRPAWVATSTHEGEEVMMAATHVKLSARLHGSQPLLTVIIPRHPSRAPFILQQLHRQFPELTIGLRSRDQLPTNAVSVFIVDTLGETSLFFDTIATVAIGGTFVKRGGHNPIEPLRAGCQVFLGPNMQNFSDILKQLALHLPTPEALRTVSGPEELALALEAHFECHDGGYADTEAAMKTVGPREIGSRRLTGAMRELAVSTLSLHEQRIARWLVEDKA